MRTRNATRSGAACLLGWRGGSLWRLLRFLEERREEADQLAKGPEADRAPGREVLGPTGESAPPAVRRLEVHDERPMGREHGGGRLGRWLGSHHARWRYPAGAAQSGAN